MAGKLPPPPPPASVMTPTQAGAPIVPSHVQPPATASHEAAHSAAAARLPAAAPAAAAPAAAPAGAIGAPAPTPANSAPTMIGGGPMTMNKAQAHLGQAWDRASEYANRGAQWVNDTAQKGPWGVPAATGAVGAGLGAVAGGIHGALSDDPRDSALSGALHGGLMGGATGLAVGGATGLADGGLLQAGYQMQPKAASIAENMPPEFAAKIAELGAHRVIALKHNIPIDNFRAALEKMGYDLFSDMLPEAELTSAIASFKKLVEEK